jgi:hypothetical protein
MPPLNPKMPPEQREQFTRTWATETLEAMAGVPDDLPDLNRNLASLDNAALAEQAHAFITELTARLEHPPPAALMPNHELCFVAWEALNALAARGLLQIKIKQGRRYVPLNPRAFAIKTTGDTIEIRIKTDPPTKK